MIEDIRRPESYKNRHFGRIVDGIFNFGNGTGFLYEQEYVAVREALESLRSGNPELFMKAINHIIRGSYISDDERNSINEKMSLSMGGIDSDVVHDIIKDWHKGSRGLQKSYEPAFMLNIGVPVQNAYFNDIARKVLKIRADKPEFARMLDKLFNRGSSKDLMHFPSWCNKHVPEEDGSAKREFAEAVTTEFRPIDFIAVREVILRNPHFTKQRDQESAPEIQ